jgi:uncharacterized membrane protein
MTVTQELRETGGELLRVGIDGIKRAAQARGGSARLERSLTIGRPREELEQLWSGSETRERVLDGAQGSLSFAPAPGDLGTVATLRLEAAVPGKAGRLQAGQVLRRFKSLAETGEIPTLEHNPSARPGAGDEV